MTRPAHVKPLSGSYSISREVTSSVGNARTITAIRLLTLGYTALESRWDDLIGNTSIWRSIIYQEDLVECLSVTPKSAKAILRSASKTLDGVELQIGDTKYKILDRIDFHGDYIIYIWNQDIVEYLSQRVHIGKSLGL